jgi:3-methyl-2-oxobutanoate hydroxymethyltransferase
MKWTTAKIKGLKNKQRFAAVTAYDALTGRLAEEAGFPLVLVGDSLANTILGYANTLPVTMDEMIHHTRAAVRGAPSPLVVADMPFMSYQASLEQGLTNAGRFIKEAGADSVKIEGGTLRTALIEQLGQNGIPVLGHIGLTPQSVKETGYKVQGRDAESARRLMDDAMAVEQAGAFAVVLECVPTALAQKITAALRIPTLGIGAGPHCDGQVLVFNDVVGFTRDTARFVKRYAELHNAALTALNTFKTETENGIFPGPENSYE